MSEDIDYDALIAAHDMMAKACDITKMPDQAEMHRLTSAAIRALRAAAVESERDAGRYRWLVDRVIACDYGDNETQGTCWHECGWRIRHDLLPKDGGRQPAFMFGASVKEAIDAAMSAQENREKGQ